MLTSNDEYRGYYIPQGTVVLANIWYVALQIVVVTYSHIFYLRNPQGNEPRRENIPRRKSVSTGTIPRCVRRLWAQ